MTQSWLLVIKTLLFSLKFIRNIKLRNSSYVVLVLTTQKSKHHTKKNLNLLFLTQTHPHTPLFLSLSSSPLLKFHPLKLIQHTNSKHFMIFALTGTTNEENWFIFIKSRISSHFCHRRASGNTAFHCSSDKVISVCALSWNKTLLMAFFRARRKCTRRRYGRENFRAETEWIQCKSAEYFDPTRCTATRLCKIRPRVLDVV